MSVGGCPSCGEPVIADSRFCHACGHPLAGVGKSRLGWEFRKYIDGLAEQVWWHRGRCLSYGDGVAFWALAEMVRQRLGIAEEDPAEVAAGKLSEGLDRFVPDPGERAYAGLRLGRLLGVAFAGDTGGGWAGRSCSPGGGCSSSGSPLTGR